MIDLGISKLALIGIVALVVIGPERLPRVARTVGAFVGKAQRYVSEVKAEVNRSIELEDLQKMKQDVESAARQIQGSVQNAATDFERNWKEAEAQLDGKDSVNENTSGMLSNANIHSKAPPAYSAPKKNWRLKRSATPQWYKKRTQVPTKVLSGAARVAKHRPKSSHTA